MTLYYIAAGLIVFLAIFHSWGGEDKLIKPTLAVDDEFIKLPMTQAITRFGWHSTSLFMLFTAFSLIHPDVPEFMKLMVGAVWLILGITNLIMTKAKHPGGPLLSIIGVLSILGYIL